MKKSLLLIATAVLAMTACTKDVAEMDGGANALGGEINVSAAIDENTRTSMTANGDNIDIAWVAGDGIGMFASDANSDLATNLKYVAATSAADSKLNADGESIQWGTGTHQFYAYYPYTTATDATAVPISVPAVQEQSEAGNLDHLQPYAFLYADKSSEPAASVQLSFKNALSVLEVNLCSEAGTINCDAIIFRADDATEVLSTEGATIDLTTGAINTASATNSNEIKIELASPAVLDATTPQSFYMMVTPGHAGKRFSIYAVVNGEEVLLGNKGIPAAGLPAGVKATLDFNVPAIDLSANGTANCYLVNEAATTYKLNATVMGNGDTGLTYGLSTASGITSTTIAPTQASLVWTTGVASKPVITDVTFKEGYIYFSTPADFVDGNAVVAAKDASGKILWSWHIWALEGYDFESNLVAVRTPAAENGYEAEWIDRNLGAVNNNDNGDMGAYGMYYQWGRKDPFAIADAVAFADGSVRNQPTLNDMGNETAWDKRGTSGGATIQERIADAIEHPDYYIVGTGDRHNWATSADLRADEAHEEWASLWGNPKGHWYGSEVGAKSLFDPCPAGYRLPSSGYFKFMAGHKGDSYAGYISEAPWRHNNAEIVSTEVNGAITWKNYRRGFNHYIEDCHAGTTAEAWTHYATGKTWFVPCTGMAHYNGFIQHGGTDNSNRKDHFALAVNQPVATDSYYGNRVAIHWDGAITGIQYVYDTGWYREGNACATPARCIKDYITPPSEDSAIDLSAEGTANCYIATTSNTAYKLNATVKGNGVVAFGSESTTIAPTKARLLWAQTRTAAPVNDPNGWPSVYGHENAEGVIVASSVTLKDGYINFTTGTFEGNAVIVATDNDDNVLWSWHIWFVKGYNPTATDYYVTTMNINTYMMDRNLGAFTNPAEGVVNVNTYVGARGLYYQWGRKDPFIGNVKHNGYAPQMAAWDASGNVTKGYANYGDGRLQAAVDVATTGIDGDAAKLVAWTASHPINFLSAWSGTGYSWMNGVDGTTADWGKLWGNQAGANKGGIKTMYDPCPVGYRVPSTGHFKFITAHGDNASTGYGNTLLNWKFNCVEKIFDESGNTINGDLKAEPYGLNFYIKGAKTASPDAVEGVQDYGVLPADQTTAYFPAQGLNTYSGGGYDGRIYVQTNRVTSGNTIWMKAEDGNFYYNATSGSYDQQAKALPVRCIRE